jgi:hypothetical protein
MEAWGYERRTIEKNGSLHIKPACRRNTAARTTAFQMPGAQGSPRSSASRHPEPQSCRRPPVDVIVNNSHQNDQFNSSIADEGITSPYPKSWFTAQQENSPNPGGSMRASNDGTNSGICCGALTTITCSFLRHKVAAMYSSRHHPRLRHEHQSTTSPFRSWCSSAGTKTNIMDDISTYAGRLLTAMASSLESAHLLARWS